VIDEVGGHHLLQRVKVALSMRFQEAADQALFFSSASDDTVCSLLPISATGASYPRSCIRRITQIE